VTILSRYLAREFLLATLGVLSGLILVWVAADTLLHIEDFQSGAWAAIRNAMLRSLELLPLGVPTACGIGVIFSLSRATRNLEITALRCGGIPLGKALAPILVLSVLMAVGLAFFQDSVLIPAKLEVAGAEEPEEEERPRMVGDRWWYVSDEWMFSATDFDARARRLIEVTVFRFDAAHAVDRRLDAGSALYLGEGQWRFFDVLDQSFSDDGLRDLRRFEKLALNLGVDMTSAVMRDASGRAMPEFMTVNGLAEAAAEASRPDEIRTLESAYHARLALPLSVFVLVLLMLPEGLLGNDRDDASLPKALLRALALMTAFWAIWTLARLASQREAIPSPALPIWGTMAALILYAGWRFRMIKE